MTDLGPSGDHGPMRRARVSFGWLLLAAGAACSEDVPQLDLAGTMLDIGVVDVGETGRAQLRVQNRGSGVLKLEDSTPTRNLAGFQMRLPSPELGPGQIGAIEFEFRPHSLGLTKARFRIGSNDPERREVEIEVHGEGTGDASVRIPDGLAFPPTLVGSSRTQILEIVNRPFSTEIAVSAGENLSFCDDGPAEFCVRLLEHERNANGHVELGPDEVMRVEAVFAPIAAGPRRGTLELAPCSSSVCGSSIVLTGIGVERALTCDTDIVDFGDGRPDGALAQTLVCGTLLPEGAEVSGWALEGEDAARFSTPPSEAVRILPDQPLELELGCRPSGPEEVRGTLVLSTAGEPVLSVELRGSGGGARIDPTPSSVDFGRAAVGTEVRTTLVVSNTGYAPLQLSGAQFVSGAMETFALLDFSPVALQPGESQPITLAFAPTTAGAAQSTLRVLSNDAAVPAMEVSVSGHGVELPPCRYSLDSNTLDFASSHRERSIRRGLTIHNLGNSTCLVRARLAPESDPVFAVASPSPFEIAASSSHVLEVVFAAPTPGPYAGELELSLSTPGQAPERVSLTAQVVDSGPILAPREVDFGSAETGCSRLTRTVRVLNPSPSPMLIQDIDLSRAGDFSLAGLPTSLPTLPPFGLFQFEVSYHPSSAGQRASSIQVEVRTEAGSSTHHVSLFGEASSAPTQSDVFAGNRKVDILLVVDQSGGMGSTIDQLADHMQYMLDGLDGQGVDWHVGVTTTDLDDDQGRLMSAAPRSTYESSPTGPAAYRFVSPSTQPLPSSVLVANLSKLLSGGGAVDESGLQASLLALTPPLAHGRNAGFRRDDADLVVMYISDEPDQSAISVEAALTLLRSFERPRAGVRVHPVALVAPTVPGTCSGPGGTASSAGRYASVAEQLSGTVQSICTTDWSRTMDFIVDGVSVPLGFDLSGVATPGTVTVRVDGMDVSPTGGSWSLASSGTRIEFAPFAAPARGAEVQVDYIPQCRSSGR